MTRTTRSQPIPWILALALLASLVPARAGLAGPVTRPAQRASTPSGWDAHGDPVRGRRFRPIEKVIAHPSRFDGERVRVEGVVREVCRKKGCWMTLGDDETSVRVTFEDYAFFVPKDADGRLARVDGVFEIVETPLEEARHYLEDAGRHEEAEALTGPQRELTLVASGVLLKHREDD